MTLAFSICLAFDEHFNIYHASGLGYLGLSVLDFFLSYSFSSPCIPIKYVGLFDIMKQTPRALEDPAQPHRPPEELGMVVLGKEMQDGYVQPRSGCSQHADLPAQCCVVQSPDGQGVRP